MKINIFAVGVLVLLISCASTPNEPINLGNYNPENVSEEDLVTLYIHRYCKVLQFDNKNVDWLPTTHKYKIAKIPSGIHTLHTKYDNGQYYSETPVPVMGNFEKGNTYLLSFSADSVKLKLMVKFHIFLYNDEKIGTEVTIRGNH
jgi:hypothetical protein